jgi:hypothetical protein
VLPPGPGSRPRGAGGRAGRLSTRDGGEASAAATPHCRTIAGGLDPLARRLARPALVHCRLPKENVHAHSGLILLALLFAPGLTPDVELKAGGEAIGSEESVRAQADGAATRPASCHVAFPGGEGTLKQEARYGKDGKLAGYTLDIDALDSSSSSKPVATATGYALSLTPRGGTAPLKSETVATSGVVVLLDNNFARSDLFTRTLKDRPGATTTVTALVRSDARSRRRWGRPTARRCWTASPRHARTR